MASELPTKNGDTENVVQVTRKIRCALKTAVNGLLVDFGRLGKSLKWCR